MFDKYFLIILFFFFLVSMKNLGISILTREKKLFIFFMDFNFINNGSIIVVIQMGDGNLYRIYYVFSDIVMR